MNFGWKHYYRPLPKPLQSLLTNLKIFIGAISVGSYFSEREELAFWLLVFGAGVDFVLNFFAEAPVETLEKTSERLKRDNQEFVEEIKNGENE